MIHLYLLTLGISNAYAFVDKFVDNLDKKDATYIDAFLIMFLVAIGSLIYFNIKKRISETNGNNNDDNEMRTQIKELRSDVKILSHDMVEVKTKLNIILDNGRK